MADIKPTSFRINEDDVDRFKKFIKEQGFSNQAEAFNSIMQTVEMSKAKELIKDRAKEIEIFQDTVNNLVSMFLNSLNINQLSEERIREELSKELNSKQDSISMAFEQIRELESENKKFKEDNKELSDVLKGQESEFKKLNSDIVDKQKNVDKLNSNNDLLQEQLQEYKQYKTNYKNLSEELEQGKTYNKELEDANSKLMNENELLNNKVESNMDIINFYKQQIEINNESISELKNDSKELEDKKDQQIEKLKVEHKVEIDNKNKSISEMKSDVKILDDKYNNQLQEVIDAHEKNLKDIVSNLNSKHEIELSKKDIEIQKLKNIMQLKSSEKNKVK